MNPLDLFIIYLAVGAPVGVYYFLKNHRQKNLQSLWLKSLFVFFFWMPFAFALLRRGENFRTLFGSRNDASADAERQKSVGILQKEIERILPENDWRISIYEFRETIERYVGLTLARQNGDKISEHEKEIFRVAKIENIELGAVCLNRRNRKRLSIHQSVARQDFLHLIEQMLESDSDKSEVERLSIELTATLEDLEAQNNLEKMFAAAMQTARRANVPKLENDLWKPETLKPPPAELISPHLRTANATTRWRGKD